MRQPSSTIIFDLSEVLISGLVGVEDTLGERLQVSPASILPALDGRPLHQLFCGRMTEDAYLAQLIERTGWHISTGELKSIIRQNFRRRVPMMQPILETLAARHELVILSDHASEWVGHIRRIHPFLQSFLRQVYSFELGQTKSDPSTFTRALGVLHKSPANCIFVDDFPANIAAAEQAGIRGIKFSDADELSRQLTETGFLA